MKSIAISIVFAAGYMIGYGTHNYYLGVLLVCIFISLELLYKLLMYIWRSF